MNCIDPVRLKRCFSTLVLMGLLGLVDAALAQHIVRAPDEGASLTSRWDWATEMGEERTIGYTIQGNAQGWRGGSARPLASLLEDHAIAVRKSDLDFRVAILLTVSGSTVTRISSGSLDSASPREVDFLYWLGDASQIESYLFLTELELSDGPLRDAVWTIGHHRTVDEAGPWIKRFLTRANSIELRKAAVYAYTEFAREEALEEVIHLALSDPSIEVARAAAYALGNLPSESAVGALKRVIDKSARLEVRKAAVYALGNADSPEARRILLALILDES